MRKIFGIKLSSEERCELKELSRKRSAAAHKVLKARALLLCDESEDGESLKDREIIAKLDIAPAKCPEIRLQQSSLMFSLLQESI